MRDLKEALKEASNLRDFAESTHLLLSELRVINMQTMEIANVVCTLGPLGMVHPEVHDAVESVLQSVKDIQNSVGEVVEQMEHSKEFLNSRIEVLREEIEELHGF